MATLPDPGTTDSELRCGLGLGFVPDAPRLCTWSPDGDHLYQLEEMHVSRQKQPLVVDKCRYCGTLAFAVA